MNISTGSVPYQSIPNSMHAKTCFQKVRAAFVQGGVGLVLKRLAAVSFETNRAYWFERDLSLPLGASAPRLPLQVRFQSRHATLEWLKGGGREWMLDPEEIRRGIAGGHWYPHVVCRGRIVASIKISFTNAYITDFKRQITLARGVAYHTDIYVEPDFRELKVARYLLVEAMRFLKEKGFSRMRCHIPPWNERSIRAHSSVGFRKIGYIRFVRIFFVKVYAGYCPGASESRRWKLGMRPEAILNG
jgi:GNAT superfamily N-acetyltransferase